MTVTLSPQTETLLQETGWTLGQEARALADALLLDALEAAELDYEETCQAIAEGFADIDAGRTVSFEEARAGCGDAARGACKFAETNWYTVVMTERMISPELGDDDRDEYSLRPKRLREFIGQPKIKENLSIFMTAAQRRGEALDHVLLHGPPGLGKTSLSLIIANEMGAALRATSGPAIERPGDLVAILTNLEAGSVLFLDEIHRLSRPVEEILYSAMEDYQVDIVIGQGPSARTVKLDVQPFTLVGATTRSGMLSSPLRDRFGIQHTFEFYTPEDLVEIITRSAAILEVDMDLDGAGELARRSRGTPRIANRLLKRVRDFAQVKADGHISREVAAAALAMLEVDALGLDEFDRRLLRILIEKFGGGPVGVETMAAAMSEERDTLEDVYEPYLMQMGFLQRTPRGRVATRRAWEHLGLTPPPSSLGQGTLL